MHQFINFTILPVHCAAPLIGELKVKKIVIAGAVSATLMGVASANAADLGTLYKAQPAMVPVRSFSWTGCYIGGNIGWGWGRDTVSIPDLGQTTGVPALAGVSLGPETGNTSGILGGGQLGCNYQFAPNWVIGIEGDGEAANIKGDLPGSFAFMNSAVTGTAHAQTNWIASATGRLGWTWDRVMVYAKGGAAWAGDKYSADLPAFDEHIQASVTRLGWTVGGGVEWAVWGNWSAKAEYDYYDFSTRNLSFPGTIAGIAEVVPGVHIKETIQTVKFGLNYRFGVY
jgi:outer membrane immunogenic protein